MKDEMQAKLLEWMTKGGEFVEREAPQLANEIVSLHLFGSWMELSVSLLGLLAVFMVATIFTYIGRNDWDSPSFFTGFIAYITMIVPIAGVAEGAYGVYKGNYAPRVVIVEELSDMTKGE